MSALAPCTPTGKLLQSGNRSLVLKWYTCERILTYDPHAACAIILGMSFLPKFGCCGSLAQDSQENQAAGAVGENSGATPDDSLVEEESNLLRTVGWLSAALGAVALGLIVGREIRQRYKFNRRTPYDLYAHSGDELIDVDCGVGI